MNSAQQWLFKAYYFGLQLFSLADSYQHFGVKYSALKTGLPQSKIVCVGNLFLLWAFKEFGKMSAIQMAPKMGLVHAQDMVLAEDFFFKIRKHIRNYIVKGLKFHSTC